MGIVVSFDGIDGAGKTTLSHALVEELQRDGWNVVLVDKSLTGIDPSIVVDKLRTLSGLIWSKNDAEYHHLLGYDYWLYLVAAYYSALFYHIIPILKWRHDIVIIESWFLKFLSKLHLKGYDLKCISKLFPSPEVLGILFMLDVSPKIAWSRNRNYSYSELGGQDGYGGLDENGFIGYQTQIRQTILNHIDTKNTVILEAGMSTSVGMLCCQVRQAIADSVDGTNFAAR